MNAVIAGLKDFMPAFDYRTYGEVGVNYEPEIIGMLTEFSDNEDGMLDSFCPTGTRPNIKEAIRLNLRNMMDVSFEPIHEIQIRDNE